MGIPVVKQQQGLVYVVETFWARAYTNTIWLIAEKKRVAEKAEERRKRDNEVEK